VNPNYPLVSSRAKHICEYCRAPEAVFNLPFEIEHIIPLSRGGKDDENNLALSCRSCNLYKSDSVTGFDEETQIEAGIFNPRKHIWTEHFTLDRKTGEITGLTSVGKATISRLRINSNSQLAARISWLELGLFE
jgi:hypothetical protein